MQTLTVHASRTYDIHIGPGLLTRVGELSTPLVSGRNAIIVSDSNVWPLYGATVEQSLVQSGFAVDHFVFPAGEASKTPQTLLEVLTFLAQKQLTRSDVVFALGGGVTGDLAGLAASLYLRGLPCIQLPTSLLAMVDSSVGGKTAVDLPEGKNLVGTFTQPHLVLCDTNALSTLPPAVYAEGWAEIIKYGMIRSRELLDFLLENPAGTNTEWVISHCLSIKAEVVNADEEDHGLRQLLNFGHTLGHAIERCSGYRYFHGEGVAIGMHLMTKACVKQGKCPAECLSVLDTLLNKYSLPSACSMARSELLAASRADKKRRGDAITLIQPDTLGNCTLYKTDFHQLDEILRLTLD